MAKEPDRFSKAEAGMKQKPASSPSGRSPPPSARSPLRSTAVCDFCSGRSGAGKCVYATRQHDLSPVEGLQIISEPG